MTEPEEREGSPRVTDVHQAPAVGECAAGPGPGATALARLRWARELVAGVAVAREAGLLEGAQADASEVVDALDALSAQVKSWRAWVKDSWIPARARERVLGLPEDPALRLDRDERLHALDAANQRVVVACLRLTTALTAAGRGAARAVPPCTEDGHCVSDLSDPADGSARP